MSRRLILMAAALLMCGAALAQSTSDVLRAFRKVEAAALAGVNFRDYGQVLSAANAELRSFADTNRGRPAPESIKAMTVAYSKYQAARDRWDEQHTRDDQYAHNELAISTYFEGKRENIRQIQSLWDEASRELERAADLVSRENRRR